MKEDSRGRLTCGHEGDDVMLQASLSTEDAEIEGKAECLPLPLENVATCWNIFVLFDDSFRDSREGGLSGGGDVHLVILVKVFHFLIPCLVLSFEPQHSSPTLLLIKILRVIFVQGGGGPGLVRAGGGVVHHGGRRAREGGVCGSIGGWGRIRVAAITTVLTRRAAVSIHARVRVAIR